MKKLAFCLILALTLSVLFACGAFADGTDAVEIKQHLLERGTGQTLVRVGDVLFQPAVYADGAIDSAQSLTEFHYQSYDLTGKVKETSTFVSGGDDVQIWNEKVAGALDKMTFVENVGTGAVYFRTVFAFPDGENGNFDDKVFKRTNTQDYVWTTVDGVTIGDKQYKLYIATYQKTLNAGQIAPPSLLQIAVSKEITNQDLAALGNAYDLMIKTEAFDAQADLSSAAYEITVAQHPWSSYSGVSSTTK